MNIPHYILERLKKNEEIAKKFNAIEAGILTILNFQDFLERLLREISEKFNIPYTWISIIEESRLARQLKESHHSDLLKASTTFVTRQNFLAITGNRVAPILANTGLDRYISLVPQRLLVEIGSISIAPITLDGEIVGSINQADYDRQRFEPGMDASLLEQLALKVSLCLSNVAAHEQLQFLAFHDPLTRLLNRGVMERVLDREFHRSVRYGLDLSVIFMDLDDFKSINDTYGHDIGDLALCHVANCLTELKRDSDVIARFAGDEYVAILPSTPRAKAQLYMDRVKTKLAQTPLPVKSNFPGGPAIHVRLSNGISSICPSAGKKHIPDSPNDLLKQADKELYEAKKKKNALKSTGK